MEHKDWERLGATAGIISAVTLFVAFMLPGTLASDASATDIQKYFVDNRTQLLTQTVLVGFSMLLFLLFIATFRNVVRRTESGTGELSALMSGSALIAVAMILICMGVVAALAWRSAAVLDVSITRFLFDLVSAGFVFIGIPTAVFLGTAAVLMRRTEVFPAWVAGIVGLAALVNLLSPLSLFFTEGAWGPLGVAAFAAPIAFMLALLGTSVVLVRHPEAGDVWATTGAMPHPAA